MSNRRSIVQGGLDRRTRLNPNVTFTEDTPSPHESFAFETDPDKNEERESNNPISARFYGRGDLTDDEFESLGFHSLPDGAEVVDNLNQATNIEHILPDGTRHFIPAAGLTADPRNPDNIITARNISDEGGEEETEDEKKKRMDTKNKEYQRNRSILTRGGLYRLVYYPGKDRNSKIGGVFKYYLREEIPFSLRYYGIYKKSEEELLTEEELNSNCLIDSLKEYPEEQEILKYGHLSTYQILDAWNFNPICELLKCNIEVHRISVVEKKVRVLKFPSRSIQCDYTKTLKICIHNEHFFPYVENTGFLMSYIKKCGWKEGSNWKNPTKKKEKNYFNSINLVKQLVKQKDDYLIEKTSEERIKIEETKKKIRKLKNTDFPDYPEFNKKDNRIIKKFDYKKYCVPPVIDPNDPNFDLIELEKHGMLKDKNFINDIINRRAPAKQTTKIEYLSTLPINIIRAMLNLMKNTEMKKVIKLKIFIINILEKHKEEFMREEECTGGEIICNEKLKDVAMLHFKILESLPYYIKNEENECFYVADMETITDIGKHVPYLICWDRLDGSDKGYHRNSDCCKKFINYLRKQKEDKINVLCHNLSYELTGLLRNIDLMASSIEPKNNRVYKASGYIFGEDKKLKKIVFSDTLAKIPMAESQFEKMFNLEKGKKTNFPYSFYNNDTAFKDEIKTNLELYDDMKELFEEQYLVKKEDNLFIKSFQCALDYCRQDVETLRQGWNCMRKMVLELTGIDYNKVVTISKLAYLTCLKEGCYDGVTECRGKTESFIRKCIVGGRTMISLIDKKYEGIRILNEEEDEELQNGFDYNYTDDTIYPEKLESKFGFSYSGNNIRRKDIVLNIPTENEIEEEKEIEEENEFESPRPRVNKENYKEYQMYDECSLYPSGIVKSRGIVKGNPVTITEEQAKSKSFLEIANEYFIKIKINSVGKKYFNPFTNYLREDGKRVWTNDIEGKIVYIDRVYLEILEEYHGVEWECLGGLMYTGEYNTKIKDLIKKFYEVRLKFKKEKNPLELVLKLILNNLYGTNIIRPNEERTHWICGKRVRDPNYMYKVWDKYGIDNVEGWEIKRGMLKIKIKNAFDTNHWCCAHWGCVILSESKKILAGHTIPIDEHIIYGDTDSFVASKEGIEKLKKLQPESFGNNLGQLKLEHHTSSSNMYIEKGIFLSPKLYLIKEVNKDTGEIYWKSTAKGVPLKTREIVCRQKFNGNWLTMFYGMIYRKNKVYFDLLNGGDRIRMDFSSDNTVSTVDEFFRKLGGYK